MVERMLAVEGVGENHRWGEREREKRKGSPFQKSDREDREIGGRRKRPKNRDRALELLSVPPRFAIYARLPCKLSPQSLRWNSPTASC